MVEDRIEGFDDYYPCTGKQNCDLDHVYKWISFFALIYNDIKNNKFKMELGGEVILT